MIKPRINKITNKSNSFLKYPNNNYLGDLRIKQKMNKQYLQGTIVQFNSNTVQIDMGLSTNIEISKKELARIEMLNQTSYNLGDKVNLLLYNSETLKGDQFINSKLLYREIQNRESNYFYKYKLYKILLNKKNRIINGIPLRIFFNKIKLGIGGIISIIEK